MKRLIQIVYDNSSSMNEVVGHQPRYVIARELFRTEILPTICKRGDQVWLRLLRKHCSGEIAFKEDLTARYQNDRSAILSRISQINHDQSTPLYQTIKDAIEFCRTEVADEYLIFVLTDGDDTCGVRIEDLISQDLLDKYVRFFNVKFLLVQLAVGSSVSRNNLLALSGRIGGETVIIDGHEEAGEWRKKMRKGLEVSGFSQKFPLAHCFSYRPGFDIGWDDIEAKGIKLHQAMLLFQKGYLSWQPDAGKSVSQLDLAELQFLYALCFASGMSDEMVRAMLVQLKKPYYYRFDCIYWDFAAAQWRYFPEKAQVEQVPNPQAEEEETDQMGIASQMQKPFRELYMPGNVYKVKIGASNLPTFMLVPTPDMDFNYTLKEGDLVRFKD